MPANPNAIVDELRQVFATGTPEGELKFIENLMSSTKIVCAGAGRVGLSMASFAKRLRHMGWEAYWIQDVTLPRLGEGDLMLIGSGSGETESIVSLGEIAVREKLRLGLVTATPSSRLANLADFCVVLQCSTKHSVVLEGRSSQPMTSLFEQACLIYLDSLVVELMFLMDVSEAQMKERHNTIE